MSFFYFIALWICCALFAIVPIVHLFRSASEGELDMSTAVVIAFILISLGVLTAFSAGSPRVFSLLLAMLVAGVVAPWLGAQYSRTLHRQIDEEYITKYRAAIERDPRNSGAHALLAEALVHQRRYADAIAHYEAALALSPDPERNPHFDKWTRRLNAARTEKAAREARQRTGTRT